MTKTLIFRIESPTDGDGDPYMALSQRGWREVVDAGNVQALADNGITVDPSTVRDGELRDRSVVGEPEPSIEQPALFEVVGEVVVDVEAD